MIFEIIAILIVSFCLGSIPTAFLLVKAVNGKDLRKLGSGNIGASNARRTADNKDEAVLLYWLTSTLDALKGLVPVLLISMLIKIYNIDAYSSITLVSTAIFSILGHDTMILLKNGRGKGVSTTIGAFFLIVPVPVLAGLLVFFILHGLVKLNNAGLKSTLTVLVMAAASLTIGYDIVLKLGFSLSIILIIIRHKENISLMLKRNN